MEPHGCWAPVLPAAGLSASGSVIASLNLAFCPFAVVLQWRVRARGFPSRRHQWWLELLELLGCLFPQLRRGRAERREAVQQPHVSEPVPLHGTRFGGGTQRFLTTP